MNQCPAPPFGLSSTTAELSGVGATSPACFLWLIVVHGVGSMTPSNERGRGPSRRRGAADGFTAANYRQLLYSFIFGGGGGRIKLFFVLKYKCSQGSQIINLKTVTS